MRGVVPMLRLATAHVAALGADAEIHTTAALLTLI
jgi:hypothetical protein